LAGRWRIAYAVDDELLVVLILRVRRKEDIDYPSL
jgi:mRNA-degrading endonuclease RelE of RelBE toxin-antitoxin system